MPLATKAELAATDWFDNQCSTYDRATHIAADSYGADVAEYKLDDTELSQSLMHDAIATYLANTASGLYAALYTKPPKPPKPPMYYKPQQLHTTEWLGTFIRKLLAPSAETIDQVERLCSADNPEAQRLTHIAAAIEAAEYSEVTQRSEAAFDSRQLHDAAWHDAMVVQLVAAIRSIAVTAAGDD